MINKKLIKAILLTATKESKDIIIKELLEYIDRYDYDDDRTSHIIGILLDPEDIVTVDMFNKEYVEQNLNILLYQPEKYNIKDIKAKSVNNIECTIRVEYSYIKKIDEDTSAASYHDSYRDINFITYPKILK